MGRLKTFASWSRRLDQRVLGPGGFLPEGTSYAAYQKALARGSASPRWVNVARWLLVLAMFAGALLGVDSLLFALLIVPVFGAFLVLSFRVDRDIRVAARTKATDPD